MCVITNGEFTMQDGAIKLNAASLNGGGVYLHNGSFSKTGGLVYGFNDSANANNANSTGASLFRDGGTVTIDGTPFTGTDKGDTF